MELPIDHFRLLGVSPASDAQTVLRILDQRLDRVPDQGFTTETLQARAKLLHDSADLLSDSQRRRDYESDLLAVAGGPGGVPALDIPSSLEVAGLVLLMEAGQPHEAFDLACRSLQPPQAPALGSSREADLSLLAGLACLAAAEEARGRRHFEMASRLLQQGLQLLQRMGQLPELRQRMVHDLDRLSPYLVLDLLSRELRAQEKRSEGLELLEQLVQRRGGLEGDSDPSFSIEEFQPFFKQIRGFLTVQEQVDLFSRWGDGGSEAADFLATIALTASGFAQRKPERIASARDRLLASGRSGIEPLLANLHLLLGEVDNALATFAEGAGRDLKAWASSQSKEPLGQLCAYCRDWLAHDVLPGYRDLEADPDLEAYFGDRDVIAWVEREDRRSGRHYGPSGPPAPADDPFAAFSAPAASPLAAAPAGVPAQPFEVAPFAEAPAAAPEPPAAPAAAQESHPFDWALSVFGGGAGGSGSGGATGSARASGGGYGLDPAHGEGGDEEAEVPLRWSLPQLGSLSLEPIRERLLGLRPPSWPPVLWVALAAAVGLVGGTAFWLTRLRSPAPGRVVTLPVQPPPAEPPVQSPAASKPAAPASEPDKKPPSPPNEKPPQAEPGPTPGGPLRPLTVTEPTPVQLQGLLETWLAAKAAVLAGGALPAELTLIAREGQVDRLRQERQDDTAADQTQKIEVRVDALSVRESSPDRIAVQARLTYSDQRRDASGKVVDTTQKQTLNNVYVFGRDGNRWRLAATHSGG